MTRRRGSPKPYKPLNSYRFDVETEVVESDGKHTLKIRPDPRRYQIDDTASGIFIYDRFDNSVMPWKVFEDMVEASLKLTPRAQPQKIGLSSEYVRTRALPIGQRLRGEDTDADPPTDVTAEYLANRVGDRFAAVALSIDIVGSTAIGRSIDAEDVALVKRVFLDEMSRLVPLFHGNVLKYTGDGLLAFFPAPNLTNMADLSVDCALTMRLLVHDILNAELRSAGYPVVEVRIGLEAGEAIVAMLGSSSTKRALDLVGDFLDMSTKLQGVAPPGGIRVGEILERNLHVGWRERLARVPQPPGWPFQNERGEPLAIYSVES